MRVGIAVGLGLVCLACVGAVAADQPPLASAGLDQEARANTTVYLDAGGSVDPDGSIEQYEWIIETPDGNTTTPDCANCAKTSFVPQQTGQYNATVQVRGADGLSRSDTLYVTVSAPLALPSAPSGGGGVGTGGGGLGGGGGGTWSAVVDTGDELLLSAPRGSDFVLPTPEDPIHIDSSIIERIRESDGDIPLEAVSARFYAKGFTDPMIRQAAAQSASEGNSCKSSRGECTTVLPDSPEITEETRENMGIFAEYPSNSKTNSKTISAPNTRVSIGGGISRMLQTINNNPQSSQNYEEPSHNDDQNDDSGFYDSESDVVDDVTTGIGSGSSGTSSSSGGRERDPSDESEFGSPVP